MDATTPNTVGPTILGVVASVLAVLCKWMQKLPTVHHGKDTTHKTLQTICDVRARPQPCWKELCKWIQHCCITLQRSRNKRNVGSFWLKILTSFKLCTTTPNIMQQGVQMDTTCNIQHWMGA